MKRKAYADLELYIHIPFCIKKCRYCDFLSEPADKETKLKYVDALIEEIKLKKELGNGRQVSSIFLGGGTPSILEGGCISRIISAIKENYSVSDNAEITIECNPGTLSEEKLIKYKECGINRLSIGLQSADNMELKLLGRIHTFEEFKENYILCQKLGFQNINVDLISGLPYQTKEKFLNTLMKVIELNPSHISVYSLIIEEGTEFYDMFYGNKERCILNEQKIFSDDEKIPLIPFDEEIDREIYHLTGKILNEYGYKRYEISNYAKEGYMCRHNCGYWERKEYLGFGCGSASLYRFSNEQAEKFNKKIFLGLNLNTEAVRFKNISNIKQYIKNMNLGSKEDIFAATVSDEDFELLSNKEAMEEFVFLGLRMISGISKTEFKEKFRVEFDNIYKTVTDKFVKERLIIDNNERIYLTEQGIDISNYVMSGYLLD